MPQVRPAGSHDSPPGSPRCEALRPGPWHQAASHHCPEVTCKSTRGSTVLSSEQTCSRSAEPTTSPSGRCLSSRCTHGPHGPISLEPQTLTEPDLSMPHSGQWRFCVGRACLLLQWPSKRSRHGITHCVQPSDPFLHLFLWPYPMNPMQIMPI